MQQVEFRPKIRNRAIEFGTACDKLLENIEFSLTDSNNERAHVTILKLFRVW
jgi:hypothetical protein